MSTLIDALDCVGGMLKKPRAALRGVVRLDDEEHDGILAPRLEAADRMKLGQAWVDEFSGVYALVLSSRRAPARVAMLVAGAVMSATAAWMMQTPV